MYHVNSILSAVAAVMERTAAVGSYEMQLVAAQDEIAEPSTRYVAEEIIGVRRSV